MATKDRSVVVGVGFQLDNPEIVQQIAKQMQSLAKILEGTFRGRGLDVNIDKNVVDELVSFVQRFNTILDQLTKNNGLKITLSVSDDSIQSLKTSLEQMLSQVLSQNGAELASIYAKAVGRATSGTIKKAKISGDSPDFDPQALAKQAFSSIDSVFSQLSTQTRDLIDGVDVDILQISEFLGRSVSDALSNFKKTAAQAVIKDLDLIQKEIVKKIRELPATVANPDFNPQNNTVFAERLAESQAFYDKEIAQAETNAKQLRALANLPRSKTNQKVSASRAEDELAQLRTTAQQRIAILQEQAAAEREANAASQNASRFIVNEQASAYRNSALILETYKKSLLDVSRISEQQEKIDQRVADRQGQLQNVFAGTRQILANLGTEDSTRDLSAFLDIYEKLRLQITADAKGFQGERNFISSRVRGLQSQIAAANENLNEDISNQDPQAQARTQAQLAALNQQKDALETQLVKLDDLIGQWANYSSEVRKNQNALRSIERVQGENNKIVERVGRNYFRVSFAVKATQQEILNLTETAAKSQTGLLNENQLAGSGRAISRLKELVSQLNKELAETAQSAELQKADFAAQFQNQQGPFSGFDFGIQGEVKEAQDLLERFFDRIDAQAKEQIGKINKTLQDLDLTRASDGFKLLERTIDDTNTFNKFGDSVEDLQRRIQKIQKSFVELRTESETEVSTDGLRRLSILGETLSKEFASVQAEAQAVQSEFRQLAATNPAGVTQYTDAVAKLGQELNIIDRQSADFGSTLLSQTKVFLAELAKAPTTLESVAEAFQQAQARKVRSNSLRSDGPLSNRIAGIEGIGQSASEAQKLSQQLRELEFSFNAVVQAGGQLSEQDQILLGRTQRLVQQTEAFANSAKRQAASLKNLKGIYEFLDKGVRSYVDGIGLAIIRQADFLSATALLSAGILSIRTAFTSVIEESKAFSRTLTVIRSNSLSLEQASITLRKSVRDVSVELGVAVTETAEIAKQLGSAGFELREVQDGLKSTSQLTVATSASVEETTRSVAGIYRVFGDQIKATAGEQEAFGRINDVLISVYQNHQAELDELNQGFRFASSAAKAAGFSFEDTAAFLSVLNDNMIKSGAAGRGLQVIFAQLAAKTKQFSNAFQIKVDKNSPLNKQFIQILEGVNAQLSSGALSAGELDKQFKIFGLRGARSFLTLARQIDDVKQAMRQTNDESQGLSNEVSRIVTKDTAKQFEIAKQALLDIVRQGLEPLKETFVALAEFAKGLRTTFEGLGPLFKTLFSGAFKLGIFTSLIVVITTLIAIILRAASLAQIFVGSLLSVAKANATVAASSQATSASLTAQTGVVARAAAANNAMTASAARAAIGIRALGASFVGGGLLAGAKAVGLAFAALGIALIKIVAVIAVVGGLIFLFDKLTNSAAKSSKSMADFSSELTNLNRQNRDLTKFNTQIDKIERNLKTTAVSARFAGEQIVEAFDAAGTDLVPNSLILNKSFEEIGSNYQTILAQAREYSTLQKNILKDQEEQVRVVAELQALNSAKGLLEGSESRFNFRGFFSARDAQQLLASVKTQKEIQRELLSETLDPVLAQGVNLDDVKGATGPLRQYLETTAVDAKELKNAADQQARAFNNNYNKRLAEGLKVAANPKKFEAEFKKLAIDEFVKNALNDGVERGTLETIGAEINAKEVIEKILADGRARIESQIKKGIIIPIEARIEILPTVGDTFETFVETLGAPVNQTVFDRAVDDAERLKRQLRSLQADIGNIDLTAAFTPDKVVEGLDADSVKSALRAALSQTNQAGLEQFSKGFGIPVDISTSVENLADQVATKFSVAGQGLEFSFDNISKISKTIGETLSESPEKALATAQAFNRGLENSAGTNLTQQGQGNFFGSLAKETTAAIRRENEELNKRVRLLNEITELSQRQKSFEVAGVGIAQAEEQLTKLVGQLQPILSKVISGEATPEDREQLKTLSEAQKLLEERVKVFSDIKKAQRQVLILDIQNAKTLNQNLLQTELTNRAYGSQLTILLRTVAQQEAMVELSIKELKAQQLIRGSVENTLEATNQLITLRNQLVKQQFDIVSGVTEENSLRFGILRDIEIILDKKNKQAGAEFKILDAQNKIALINRDLARFQDDSEESINERARLYRKLVDIVKDLSDVEEEVKKKEQDLNGFLDKRVEILKKIRESFKTDADEFGKAIRASFERAFATDQLQAAFDLANKIDLTPLQVLANQGDAIDRFARGLKEGTISASSLSPELRKLVEDYKELSSGANEYQNEVVALQKQLFAKDVNIFSANLSKGDFAQAQNALDRLIARNEDINQFDSSAYRDNLAQVLVLQENLINASAAGINEIQVKFNLINKDEIQNFIQGLKDRLQQDVKTDLLVNLRLGNQDEVNQAISKLGDVGRARSLDNNISGTGATNLFRGNEALAKINGSVNQLESSIQKIDRSIGNYVSQVTDKAGDFATTLDSKLTGVFERFLSKKALTDAFSGAGIQVRGAPVRKALGGFIPGFGGGDKVPALLEQGEFVLPKEAVRRYGQGFLEKMRTGQFDGIRKFQDGGLNGTLDFSGAVEGSGASGSISTDLKLSFDAFKIPIIKFLDGEMGQSLKEFASTLNRTSKILTKSKDVVQARSAAEEIAKKLIINNAKIVAETTKATRANIVTGSGVNPKDAEVAQRARPSSFKAQIAALEAQGKAALEGGQLKGILVSIFDQGFAEIGTRFGAFLASTFQVEFARANAQVYKTFIDTIGQINDAYRASTDEAISQIARNESSYYGYLNRIEQAERVRIDARIKAEDDYRNSLRKTGQVFSEFVLSSTTSLADGASSSFKSLFGSINTQLFDETSVNIDRIVGSFEVAFKGIEEALQLDIPGLKLDNENIKGLDSVLLKFIKGFNGSLADGITKLYDGEGELSLGSTLTAAVGPSIERLVNSLAPAGNGADNSKLAATISTTVGVAVSSGFDVVSSSFLNLFSSLGSILLSSFGQIVSITAGENGDRVVKYIEKFVAELPEVAPLFLDKLIENIGLVVDAIAAALPEVLTVLAEELPSFIEGLVSILEESAPKIVAALTSALPALIRGIVPQLVSLINVVIAQLPEIVEGLAAAVPVLIVELVKALPRLIPAIIIGVIKAVAALIYGLMSGILGIFGINLPEYKFHSGGLIPGNDNDIPIIAQGGEGVISRKGMSMLGTDGLDAINSGNIAQMNASLARSSFHTGGVVGSAGSRSGGTYNDNSSVTIEMKPLIAPGTSNAEIDRQSKALVDSMDRQLAKKAQDRNSEFVKIMKQ